MKNLVVIAPVLSPEHERLLTASDREHLERFSSPHRRAEVAAWRAVVRREMGSDAVIGYNEVGAPIISVKTQEPQLCCTAPDMAVSQAVGAVKNTTTGSMVNAVKWTHIGISHSGDYVAVIFSCGRCAIDIEDFSRSFDGAADRFISVEEHSIEGCDNTLFKAAVWCAKETLYKLSWRRGLSLLDDLRITAVDFSGMQTGDPDSGELPFGAGLYGVRFLPEDSDAERFSVKNSRGIRQREVLTGGRITGAIRSPQGSWESCGMQMILYGDYLVVFTT